MSRAVLMVGMPGFEPGISDPPDRSPPSPPVTADPYASG